MKSLKFISLGLGQQSTVLYLMSSLGELPRADYAIFADTGSESKQTYQYLKWLLNWQQQHNGVPIVVTRKKPSLYKDLIHGTNSSGTRFASIPVFTKNLDGSKGILKRQCTEEYKIAEINKAIRKIYGLKKYQRTAKTEIWLGITVEELGRLKYPRYGWQIYFYPFCNLKMIENRSEKQEFPVYRRSDCTSWLKGHGFPIPPKSACFFCPYQSNARWLDMKRNHPKEWDRAVRLDQQIRDSSKMGGKQPIYLHKDCVPLSEANLNEDQLSLFSEECDGVCDV